MSQYTSQFQELLRELFQFDGADVDFGIYRIMNKKHDVIERFIEVDLPTSVARELELGALGQQARTNRELEQVAQQIRDALGPGALDDDGVLDESYHQMPIGRQYEDLKARVAGRGGRRAEAYIFNHLYTFFSRYYERGDFISKRRYSRDERYSIPYNGEEVYLYWANNDQYYIKTAEYFRDYKFNSDGVTVSFRLLATSVEQNHVSRDKRFFVPCLDQAVWQENSLQLVVPFEYRTLTTREENTFGSTAQQSRIVDDAVRQMLNQFKENPRVLTALTTERDTGGNGHRDGVLAYHLQRYTSRNTSDYFIHKDLKRFLTRELDFYLKNEVFRVDDLVKEGQEVDDGQVQTARVIRSVGTRVIDFLGQIEDFQRMLWEKRKLITETQYCITVGNVDKSLYAEISACDAQWAEWKRLFGFDEHQTRLIDSLDGRETLLSALPTLVLDTKHFDTPFVDQLLAYFDDLDGVTNGLLVHSENLQALNLLAERYRESIQCIYVDPPFNTDGSQFAFRDAYRNSTWLCLMEDRLRAGKNYLTSDGTAYIHLDHNSNFYCRFLIESVFGEGCLLNEVVWRIGWVSGYKTAADRYVRNHETIFVCGKRSQPYFNKDRARIPYRMFREEAIAEHLEGIKGAWNLRDASDLRLKLVFKDSGDKVYKIGLSEKDGAYNVEDTWNSNEYEELHSNKIKRNRAEYTPRGSEITQKPEQLLRRVIEVS